MADLWWAKVQVDLITTGIIFGLFIIGGFIATIIHLIKGK